MPSGTGTSVAWSVGCRWISHRDFALDPAGRRLAVNNADLASPRLVILEVETGRVLANWSSHVGIGAIAWSADGQLLAVGNYGRDPRVYVWDVRDGALSSVLEGHSLEVVGARFATRVTCWRPEVGIPPPGSGMRPRGSH